MVEVEYLRMLVTMAMKDGNFSEVEKNFIINIGKAHAISESTIESLFNQTHVVVIPEELTLDQRFEYACSLVQLMLIDAKMYYQELEFCSSMVEKLGFEKRLVYKLVDVIGTQPGNSESLEAVKKELNNYLK
jgi:hypothetical protein